MSVKYSPQTQTWVDKIINVVGPGWHEPFLEIHKKVGRFRTMHAATKNMFLVMMVDKQYRARAEKLGYIS